jgi:hypothetical protein
MTKNKTQFLIKLSIDFWVIRNISLFILFMALNMFTLTKSVLYHTYSPASLNIAFVINLFIAESITIIIIVNLEKIIKGVTISSNQ